MLAFIFAFHIYYFCAILLFGRLEFSTTKVNHYVIVKTYWMEFPSETAVVRIPLETLRTQQPIIKERMSNGPYCDWILPQSAFRRLYSYLNFRWRLIFESHFNVKLFAKWWIYSIFRSAISKHTAKGLTELRIGLYCLMFLNDVVK